MSYTYSTSLTELETPAAAATTRCREKNGVVFTKRWVVELMLDLAGYRPEADLGALVAVEPAVGDGSFLVPMVERLLASCHRHGRRVNDCRASLIAVDLDPAAVARTRLVIEETLVERGLAPAEAQRLATSWVREGDYLLLAPKLSAADFVIGNPPYLRLEDMEATTTEAYRRNYPTMIGRADIYIAFFEAALKQLKPNGACAYICADRWMLNQYGGELRRLITSQFAVETVMELHRADAFEREVSAYPAITIVRRARQGSAVVARAEQGIEALGSAGIRAILTRAETAQDNAPAAGRPLLKATRVDRWFAGTAPWPCTSPEHLALLKRLEAEFYPLEAAGTGTRVSIGVATGADEIYITRDPELVEDSRLLPLAMAQDLVGGRLTWSGHYLVNPWASGGLVDLERFPRLKTYLAGHEARLRSRHVGKKSASGWYRTIDRVDHALIGKTKLYVADIKDRLVPVLDRGATYPHHNLYFIQSVGWDPEVLGGLLLSNVAQFFIESYAVRMRGGYLRFQAQYLRRIRVPRPQDINAHQAVALRDAFRAQNREAATRVACELYRIDPLLMEAF
jgi:hypothetical protein